MDGTRDIAGLLRDMRPWIIAHREKGGETDSPLPPDTELSKNLENTLRVFARCALLAG
jgi:hypothetical protein